MAIVLVSSRSDFETMTALTASLTEIAADLRMVSEIPIYDVRVIGEAMHDAAREGRLRDFDRGLDDLRRVLRSYFSARVEALAKRPAA